MLRKKGGEPRGWRAGAEGRAARPLPRAACSAPPWCGCPFLCPPAGGARTPPCRRPARAAGAFGVGTHPLAGPGPPLPSSFQRPFPAATSPQQSFISKTILSSKTNNCTVISTLYLIETLIHLLQEPKKKKHGLHITTLVCTHALTLGIVRGQTGTWSCSQIHAPHGLFPRRKPGKVC